MIRPMDKLRAMQYFIRVVEAGSFAAAARQLEVSPPAVTHLVAAFERELGVRLLRRSSRKLSLTVEGEQFFPACAAALNDLRLAEARLTGNQGKASGKLVIGTQKAFGSMIAPFLARFPNLDVDLRFVRNPKDPAASLVDVLVFLGWIKDVDLVARKCLQTRYVTCASPAYWQTRGVVRTPNELKEHDCLSFRSGWGVVLDVWKYRLGTDVQEVALKPRLVSDDIDWMIEAAIRGAGVIRLIDLKMRPYIEQGLLTPALTDWDALEAPEIHVLYPAGARRSARVGAFVAYVMEVCAEFEQWRERRGARMPSPESMPFWFQSGWVGSLTRARTMARGSHGDRT
jgi:DNA-binding transcriptional LysR family regulator